ncbi:glycoside hydrolase family 38 C-terminal domain-containing protein [Larkinella knui]|uniref:Glycoside hydrolase n=1 Tax=Larkinella knui TaxID=2025310 RepID=A0A3P1CKJ1_9BACT|nr:glycosyl hydrolase-related protein [Larkinella knui]RRB13853.1 glycoside hydrolase [Larkinella knui]
MKRGLHTVFLLACFSALQAQPVKRLYLANDDHTDYMWTGNEAQYDTAFVRMLDYYIRQIDSTKNNPADFQTRFNCDGSYWLKIYQKYRPPAQFNKLLEYIRSGHISSPLNTLVSTYGGQPTEAVLRGMYYAGQLERKHDLRFPLAVCMENQTLPFGLSSLWAGSGARYSWRGVCSCASKIESKLKIRKHQLYRYRGFDNRSVLMKWYNRSPQSVDLGGYAEARTEKKIQNPLPDISSRVPVLEALCDTISPQSAYPYNVAGAFGYGWDDLATFQAPAFVAAAQNTTTPLRKVRVSNEEDFFRDVERSYQNIPAQSVSFGNEWDVYPASMNETTAEVRRATEKLRTAEALAAFVSLKDSTFFSELTSARQAAWEAYGLYWEHDWTADGPVSRQERAAWQIKQKNAITSYADTLYHRALAAMGNQIKKANQTRFYVFNPLSWVRSDVADFLFLGTNPVKVIDLQTNTEVASQVIRKEGKSYLRIWAENIPSVGYKVFEIQPGVPARKPVAAQVKDELIQNAYYRLRLRKSGVISELVDLRAGNRAVVSPVDGRFFNDLGSVNPDAGNPLEIENEGPVSVTLKAVSNDPIAHTVRVTLFKNSRDAGPPRIDIENRIDANFGDVKTWAFSFNLAQPTSHHEELGAILTARKEARGGHYANENARYDWLTFNHFADLSESNYGVTLSNQDCSFFKLGQSTPDSLWEQSPQLSALAGGQVDGEKLGIQQQNGATAFRYQFALTTHATAFDPLAAMRFSLEHQNPLATGEVTGSIGNFPPVTHSLLRISDKNVLLWALKPGEEGANSGVIVRFWNLKNSAVAPKVQLPQPIRSAWQTTHLETNERRLNTTQGGPAIELAPFQINTYRLELQR